MGAMADFPGGETSGGSEERDDDRLVHEDDPEQRARDEVGRESFPASDPPASY